MVLTFNGSSSKLISVQSNPALQLSKFTISLWFKTSNVFVVNNDGGGEGIMLMKGGFGSTKAGEELAYGIWISDANHIRGGFETKTGEDHFVNTIPDKYNDGVWHYVAMTYDGATLKLYVEGVLKEQHTTTAIPEVNSLPLVIGKNPLSYRKGWYKGELQKIKLFNRALSAAEISAIFADQSTELLFSVL